MNKKKKIKEIKLFIRLVNRKCVQFITNIARNVLPISNFRLA